MVRWRTACTSLTASEVTGGPMDDLIQGRLVAGQQALRSSFEVGSHLTLDPGISLKSVKRFTWLPPLFPRERFDIGSHPHQPRNDGHQTTA